MINNINLLACNLIIFGAKGDLSKKKLIPSLYNLDKMKLIHHKTKIICVGRLNCNDNEYRVIVRKNLKNFLETENFDNETWKNFSCRLFFCNLDVYRTDDFINLVHKLDNKLHVIISYLATPSNTFGSICKGLGLCGLNKGLSRVVMEKPLGVDLLSAQSINNQIIKYFDKKQIYYVDHYLFKETILNLLVFRFTNSVFFHNWNKDVIDHVQITVSEKIGIEGRWDYFDSTGQLKDMIQSHLLQILAIITIPSIRDLNIYDIYNEKIKIFKSLRPINEKNILNVTVRGQYSSGIIEGKKVLGYLEEKGANMYSCTETFVAIKAYIDNTQWSSIPFYLRTGKRLTDKYSEVVIYFKENFIPNFLKKKYNNNYKNKLTIQLFPDKNIFFSVNINEPNLKDEFYLKNEKLCFDYRKKHKKKYFIQEYERLLLKVMREDQSLFVKFDEIQESWKWIDNIYIAWKNNYPQPILYSSGTLGPKESEFLIQKDGREWNSYS